MGFLRRFFGMEREKALKDLKDDSGKTNRRGWHGKIDMDSRATIIEDEAQVVGSDKGSRLKAQKNAKEFHANENEMVSLEEFIDVASEVGFVVIDKTMILNLDLSRLEKGVEMLVSRIDKDDDLGTINISVAGYEDDSRALFTIPEIRQWCAEMVQKSRALPFLDEETLRWCMPAIAPIEIIDANKSTTQFRWNAKEFLRRFYIVVFIATSRVNLNSSLLSTLLKQATYRFQTMATQFGTTFELDDELKSEVMSVIKNIKKQKK